MQKIHLAASIVIVLACLSVCSLGSPALAAVEGQKDAQTGESDNGPISLLVGEMSESARKDPEAARLVEEGVNAMDRGDLARGEEYFQRVLTMDPKFFGVHLLLGFAHLERGKTEQGLSELRKEEEYHPGNAAVYEATAEFLIEQNLKQEAVASLRRWVAAQPGNVEAALKLSELLSDTKQYAEAVQVLEHAEVLTPESPKLRVALSGAYFENHQPEQGRALLKKGLPASTSPEDLGMAADILAENNVELDLADKYAQRALFQLEAESAVTTDETIGISNTLLLGYLWDVMGWINFRLGNYRAAVSSLEAAWLLSQRPSAGDHLGQAYEKLGRKKEAAHSYVLAEAAADGDSEDIKKRYEALTGKKMEDVHNEPIRNGASPAAGAAGASPVEQLSRLRTINITKLPHESANAIFSIVFSIDKPPEAKYLSGAESLKTMSGEITSANFNVRFPDSRPVWLFRRGMVVCGSLRGCDVVLLLPGSVHDAD